MKRAIVAAAASCAAIAGLAFAMPAQAQGYWRLDLGWSKSNDAEFQDKDPGTGAAICGNAACTTPGKLNNFGDAFLIGGGIGHRWSPGFRGDFTLTYRGGYALNGTDGSGAAFQSDISSTALMANIYWDLSQSGIRPYLGLGAGWAWNQVDPFVATSAGSSFTAPGGKKNNAAGAFMAGVSIPLSGKMMIDVGYRYTDLGRVKTDSGTVSGSLAGVPFSADYAGAEGRLSANEIVVGLRF